MPAVSKPERRRRIFLTARTVFTGVNAGLRQRKDITRCIADHGQTFQPLIQAFGRDVTANVITSLLENGIFESELKAKLAFPELYQVSKVRSLQHDVSEQDAARSENKALASVSQAGSLPQETGIDALDDYIAARDDFTVEQHLKEPPFDLPSLYPSYLTYKVQHKLLNAVQRLLEESCYDWAAKWLPALLTERKWDCAEAVELGNWAEILPQRFQNISNGATSLDSGGALKCALVATHPLRHAAVHRLPTSAKSIQKMLDNALYLIKALYDAPSALKLEAVRTDFLAKVQDMELRKNRLENELDDELREIQRQRAALDKREADAKSNMIKQDAENTKDISLRFESSLHSLTGPDNPNTADQGKDTTQDLDLGFDLEETGDSPSIGASSLHGQEDLLLFAEQNGVNDSEVKNHNLPSPEQDPSVPELSDNERIYALGT